MSMSVGKVIKAVGRFLFGAKVVGWFKNELDKALLSATDLVAKKYGDAAAQVVRDVEDAVDSNGVALTDPMKLWKAVEDFITVIVSKGGPAIAWGIAVIVVERAYQQFRQDALTAINAAKATL